MDTTLSKIGSEIRQKYCCLGINVGNTCMSILPIFDGKRIKFSVTTE